MADPILKVEGLGKTFGGIVANHDIGFSVMPGEILGIIGPNGAGKTTLMAQLTGEILPDQGSITYLGRDITNQPAHVRAQLGISRCYQITSVFPELSTLDNVRLGVMAKAGSHLKAWGDARAEATLRDPARIALATVGLEGRDDVLAARLSHGQRRQLELAMALSTNPHLLLLDEPMAGMGPDESQRLTEVILRLKGDKAIILIEHDMEAVFALADRITVLDEGRVIASGLPGEIRANAKVREIYLAEGDGTHA